MQFDLDFKLVPVYPATTYAPTSYVLGCYLTPGTSNKRENETAKFRLQKNKSNKYLLRKRLGNQRRQWGPNLAASPNVFNHCFGLPFGSQSGNLTKPTRADSMVKAFIFLPISSTEHLEPSQNRYLLIELLTTGQAVVLWACAKHVPKTSNHSDSIPVL